MQKKSSLWMLPLLLIPLGFAVYSGALGAPFVYDDTGYILTNSSILNLSNFTRPTGTRYVGFLSFALNYRLGGFNPFDYHLVNVLVHIANALLVYFIIKKLFSTPLLKRSAPSGGEEPGAYAGAGVGLDMAVAFVCAAIFIVHPINTQAVTYVTQRFASLATMFYLLSLILFLRARLSVATGRKGALTWAAYIGSLASAVVGMKTKEISFTLPVVIILIEYIFISAYGDESDRKVGKWMRAPLYLTLLIIPLSLFGPDIFGSNGISIESSQLLEGQMKDIGEVSRYVYVTTQFRVIMTYIGLLLYPGSQYLDYLYPPSLSIFEPRAFISFITLAAFLVLSVLYGIRSVKRGNRLGVLFAFGVVWFFITLSVESFLVPIQDFIFEHRMYLPGIGFILSVVCIVFAAGQRLADHISRSRSVVVIMCLATVLAVPPLLYATIERNRLWNDEVALITESIDRFPDNLRLYYARALARVHKGDYELAIEDVDVYIREIPELSYSYSVRGMAWARLGDYEKAIADFTRAIELNQSDSMPYYNRGLALNSIGRYEMAIEDFNSALSRYRKLPIAYNDRGVSLAMLGRTADATSDFEEACRLGYMVGCENKKVMSGSASGETMAGSLRGGR